jgi:hypothetical protein
MIQRISHYPEGYCGYSFPNEFEERCFTLFWDLHDCKRPFLTRKLVEGFIRFSDRIDEEEKLLIDTHETIARPTSK